MLRVDDRFWAARLVSVDYAGAKLGIVARALVARRGCAGSWNEKIACHWVLCVNEPLKNFHSRACQHPYLGLLRCGKRAVVELILQEHAKRRGRGDRCHGLLLERRCAGVATSGLKRIGGELPRCFHKQSVLGEFLRHSFVSTAVCGVSRAACKCNSENFKYVTSLLSWRHACAFNIIRICLINA